MSGFAKKTIEDVDVKGKKTLVRVDFNVPVKGGQVTNDKRLRATVPTLKYLLEKGARIVLMSHLGRPKGEVKPEFSLGPVKDALQTLLREKLGKDIMYSSARKALGPKPRKWPTR